MNFRSVVFVLLTALVSGASCNSYIFKKSDDQPEICKKVFDGYYSKPDGLQGYSLEELLTIQKCGLAYHPQFQLQENIAQQEEYPVSALINRLQTDEDDDYQYHLILDFKALTESSKHQKKLLSDKDAILTEINKAISKMRNPQFKKYSNIELEKIKEFFRTH